MDTKRKKDSSINMAYKIGAEKFFKTNTYKAIKDFLIDKDNYIELDVDEIEKTVISNIDKEEGKRIYFQYLNDLYDAYYDLKDKKYTPIVTDINYSDEAKKAAVLGPAFLHSTTCKNMIIDVYNRLKEIEEEIGIHSKFLDDIEDSEKWLNYIYERSEISNTVYEKYATIVIQSHASMFYENKDILFFDKADTRKYLKSLNRGKVVENPIYKTIARSITYSASNDAETLEEFKNELLKVKNTKKKDLDAFIELMVDTFFKVNDMSEESYDYEDVMTFNLYSQDRFKLKVDKPWDELDDDEDHVATVLDLFKLEDKSDKTALEEKIEEELENKIKINTTDLQILVNKRAPLNEVFSNEEFNKMEQYLLEVMQEADEKSKYVVPEELLKSLYYNLNEVTEISNAYQVNKSEVEDNCYDVIYEYIINLIKLYEKIG